MIKKLLELYKKYKEPINYMLVGGIGTVVSILTFEAFYKIAGLGTVASNVASWVIVVILVYILSRYFVFLEHAHGFKAILIEALAFFSARLITLLIETVIVYLGIDIMELNAFIVKTAAQVIVVILNYVASKLVIFKKRGDDKPLKK